MKWPCTKLGDICDVVSGATPKTSILAYWDGDIPWVTPKNLSENNEKYLHDTTRKITAQGFQSCSLKMLPSGSVLLSSRAPIGLVAINEIPVCTNQGFKSLIPKNGIISSEYLYWWLFCNRSRVEQSGRGATFKEVSKTIVESLEIPLPPLEEQKRIAKILDAADALRAKRRESLALLDNLIQSTFLDMFGDPVTNPMGWEKSSIKKTNSIVQIGPFGSLLHKHDYISGGIPLVNPKHINNGKIETRINETVSRKKAFKLEKYKLSIDDVVMGRRGEMGRCAVVDKKHEWMLCGTGSLFIRPNKDIISSIYLSMLLSCQSMRSFIDKIAWGITMPNLNRSMVESLNLPLPPLSLQQRFASIVEAIEKQKTRLKAHLSEVDTLFASLQSRAFQGEL